uniref:Reticulon-like protein n=1 Tax=Culicoides sonorensis TaxID=179676 RepID=A0A336LVG8_CULSO
MKTRKQETKKGMSYSSNETAPPNHDLFAFEDQPPELNKDLDFKKSDEIVGDFNNFEENFDMKPSPTHSGQKEADLLGDFLAHERQPMDRPKESPPAIPTFEAFDAQAEINTNFENNSVEIKPDTTKDSGDDFGQIQPDYLNPYAAASKLESNEKFISTDDLIGLSDNEGKAEKENAFEDCNKDEEEEEQVYPIPSIPEAKVEPPKPDPIKESPILPPVTEQPKTKIPEKTINKPDELLEAEKIFILCGLDAWFKPEALHPKVESLIYWRDVKKSGVVFGIGLSVLLALSFCSLISVFAYVSLFALAGTVAFRIYKNILQAIQKTSEGHPFKEYLETDVTLSQERVQQLSSVAVSHFNAAVTELRRLFLVEDLVDSIKFAFIALFSLPKVYETNKTVIDAQFDVVRSKVTEITDKVKAAVPIGKKTETEKDK